MGRPTMFSGGIEIEESDHIAISDNFGEIVYWNRTEWEEDSSVVTAIANAIRLYYKEGPEALRQLVDKSLPQNVAFTYQYRDGSNYKRHGEVIFSNPAQDEVSWLDASFERQSDDGRNFIADQVRVPEVFLWDPAARYNPDDPSTYPANLSAGKFMITKDDHCWHEFTGCVTTTQAPTDIHGRTIEEFLEEFTDVAKAEWELFDPMARRQFRPPGELVKRRGTA